MKKVLWLCLGLLLGMMLTACGSSGSASGMESESEILASDIIVHVEINPSFAGNSALLVYGESRWYN